MDHLMQPRAVHGSILKAVISNNRKKTPPERDLTPISPH